MIVVGLGSNYLDGPMRLSPKVDFMADNRVQVERCMCIYLLYLELRRSQLYPRIERCPFTAIEVNWSTSYAKILIIQPTVQVFYLFNVIDVFLLFKSQYCFDLSSFIPI